ncbi:MAG: hypothetical protein K1Y36_19655, partial [Blastocatellia bacterium]|nr:hypothetical protein [Blastocatellia bacterium]
MQGPLQYFLKQPQPFHSGLIWLLAVTMLQPGLTAWAAMQTPATTPGAEPKTAQTVEPVASPLESGNRVEQAIKGGEAQNFSLRLDADQCLALTVEQAGIDLTLRLGEAGKEAVLVVGNPTGSWGPEILLFVALSAGDYRLTVESPNRTARGGRYRLQMEPLRVATATDRTRFAAMQAAMTGDRERKKQTKAGFEAGLAQYEKARAGFHEAGDQRGEADALTQ